MPFDEQLKQAFATLTDRLRDDIARELARLSDELAAQADADRDRAATEAANDARADAERAAAASVNEAERAAVDRVAEAERTAADRVAKAERTAATRAEEAERAAGARVDEAERAAATRLEEAVSAAEAAAEARAREAESQHSKESVDDAVAAACAAMRSQDLAASERLVDAVRSIDRARSLTEIIETLVSAAAHEAARTGILLVRGTRLRGHRLIGFGAAVDAARDIELSLDASGVIGDAVRTGAAASSDTAGKLMSPPFDLPDGHKRVAVPIPVSGQVVAVLYADQGAQGVSGEAAWPATLEVMARHAARSLEALTAFKAARLLIEPPDVAAIGSDGPDLGGRAADEAESARRYARLLVSEIKLYHEAAVIAGRRERDLARRLGEEIGRARVLYEQRVPADVRQETDHFHAELVRTLANGDASLLGQAL